MIHETNTGARMNHRPSGSLSRVRTPERGYTLLMAVFLVALALLATTIAVPSIIGQGKREMELDMIWRGKQYERAIGDYTKKFGHNPTKIDDLVKPTNGVRFLRKAYKDPMNQKDGAWRFIYVSNGGALFGSVRYTSLQQMAAEDRAALGISALGMPGLPSPIGVPGAGIVAGFGGGPGVGGPGSPGMGMPPQQSTSPSDTSNGTGQNQNTQNNAAGNSPQNPGGFGFGTSGFGSPQSEFGSTQGGQSTDSPLSGPTLGGFIAGVGSTIDTRSLIVYKKGKTYKEWEFIYNPYEQQIGPTIQVGSVPGSTPATQTSPIPFGGPGQPGTSPFGGQPAPPELPQPPASQPSPQQ